MLLPYAEPCQIPGVGTIEWASWAESISGQYKVRQGVEENSYSCDYGLSGTCTEANIALTINNLCSWAVPGETPCFAFDATPCPERNDAWYRVDLSQLKVLEFKFHGYAAYQWVC